MTGAFSGTAHCCPEWLQTQKAPTHQHGVEVSLAGTPYWAAPEMAKMAQTGRRLTLDTVLGSKLSF